MSDLPLPLAEILIIGTWGDGDVSVVIGDPAAGVAITGHVSSSISWAARDITRPHHLDRVAEHFPDGCRVRWSDELTPPDDGPRETTLAALRGEPA